MAYSELIKNFNKVRDYMREFYVYGFKSRDEFTKKSARSYDDEKRRMESWLGDYMQFHQTADGKKVFLSIDTRVSSYNPLYKAWKAKSFTNGDITLHFILMDILNCACEPLSFKEVTDQVDDYLSEFYEPKMFDESTVRKKLKEYCKEGIIIGEKKGKSMFYQVAQEESSTFFKNGKDRFIWDAIHYFSEVAPCGVVGSYLLDKRGNQENGNENKKYMKQDDKRKELDQITFKHHYITSALDSEILCELFLAIRAQTSITIELMNRKREQMGSFQVVPLRIFISVQSGRQYVMAYVPKNKRITSYRVDSISSVCQNEECEDYQTYQAKLDAMIPHMWGVSTQSVSGNRMEHVEFIIQYAKEEQFIKQRLEREKRCGTLEQLDEHHIRFSADVYDVTELVPWIRTFICRITEIHFSNPKVEEQFKKDIKCMYRMYAIE